MLTFDTKFTKVNPFIQQSGTISGNNKSLSRYLLNQPFIRFQLCVYNLINNNVQEHAD